MSQKKIIVKDAPVFVEHDDHVHVIGKVDGELNVEEEGETVYEDSSSSVGYNRQYSKNYDNLVWNDDKAN